jgi:hypothetical protein
LPICPPPESSAGLRHDNIDDSQQQAEIQEIEAKLAELTEE